MTIALGTTPSAIIFQIVPVLILFGSNDELVPPHESIAETVSILKEHGNANVTVHVFAGADHTLRTPPADRDGWPHNAAGFPDILVAFAQHPGTSVARSRRR